MDYASRLFVPPVLTRRRVWLARGVAVAADAMQLALLPFTVEGAFSPIDDGIDILTGIVLTLLVGWHLAFVPSFIVKMVPVADLAPTWTLAVLLAVGRAPRGSLEAINARPRWYRGSLAMFLASLAIVGGVFAYGSKRWPTPPASGTTPNHLTRPTTRRAAGDFRVATFNIDGGQGLDDRVDLSRTAADIRTADADVIAIQEAHGGWFGGVPAGVTDDLQWLGRSLDMSDEFAPAEHRWWHDSFGNGILARLPIPRWSRTPMPSGPNFSGYRNLFQFDMDDAGTSVHLLTTHIDRGGPHDAQLQQAIDAFLAMPEPAILLGDLNTTSDHPILHKLLIDTPGVDEAVGHFVPAEAKPNRIDWIFTRGLRCTDAGLLPKGASDHSLAWAALTAGGKVESP